MSYYRHIIVKTYRNFQEPSNKSIRAHPLPGQGLSTSLNVECSSRMRNQHPPGTLFLIKAQITDREGTPFVYSYFGWSYRVASQAEADEFIAKEN